MAPGVPGDPIPSRTDELSAEWIQSASQGDREALEALVGRYLPELCAFVRGQMGPLLRQKESCADIVHSACRQVLEGLDAFDYRGEAAFRRWLFVACTNKLRDHEKYWFSQKRDARRERAIDDSAAPLEPAAPAPAPSGVLAQREEIERFEQAFAKLPEDYRRVISLVRFLGYSHAEAAEELERKEGAVRTLLHRALARLGLELEALGRKL